MQGLGDWSAKRAQISGDRTAFIAGDRSVTYGEFEDRVNRLADRLQSVHSLRKGDRVAAVMASSTECLEILFACAKLGVIFTPINVRLTAREIGYILADLGAEVLFHHAMFTQVTAALAEPQVRVRHRVIIGDDYEALVAAGDPTPVTAQAKADDVAVIMYTSGTTGRPKGAMLTHANMRANAVAVTSGLSLSRRDVTVTALPMFHIGGLGLHTLPFIHVGACNVILPGFDAAAVAELVRKHSATQLLLVPTMWQDLLALPDLGDKLTSLELAIISGAPGPIPVIEALVEMGVPIQEGFGMTECAPTISMLDVEHVRTKAGSIGRPLFDIEVRIVDEQGQDVAVGQVGELLVRGDNVFVGYWMKPEETAEALQGGWFHTGDLSRYDDEGFITLVDRRKDMLISGGENVYSREVEDAILDLPGVGRAAVVGAPDERWGETPVAFVVADGSVQLTAADVIDHTAGRLAKFKVPTRVEFLDALPMTATGKVQKHALRDLLV